MPRKATPPQRWTNQVVEHKMPSWVSVVIAICGILVTLWLKSGAAAEERGKATSDLANIKSSVDDIKEMLRQEAKKHEYFTRDISALQTEVAVLKSKVP